MISDRTARALDDLATFEAPNVTFIDPERQWPIVWDRAQGVHVWDIDNQRYLDLTAAFGVAATGHANPSVIQAAKTQMDRLLHAMGDVHPHEPKINLLKKLSAITFERWTANAPSGPIHGRTLFSNSGFEAVEAALKTARLATGKRGIIAFEGSYHGLGYGALTATHREHFRAPFRNQLADFTRFAPFPADGVSADEALSTTQNLLQSNDIGAVLIEPIQARGGIRQPPSGFLPELAQLARHHGALLVLDEIYTGFGRTGRWFACEHENVVPDLICLGKALTGGFPLSALVGADPIMRAAWPPSDGEAIHTSTFLGHPVGCAMALAQLQELQSGPYIDSAKKLGARALDTMNASAIFQANQLAPKGQGLMLGLDLSQLGPAKSQSLCIDAMNTLLRQGYLLLPEGPNADVLSLTPPLSISWNQLEDAVQAIERFVESRLNR